MKLDDNIINEIVDQFGRNEPSDGCSFIDQNGKFINIYPEIDTHEDLCYWIEDNFGVEVEDPDEEYFIRNYGWIRLRSDPTMSIIEMPKTKPTSEQWYSLSDWLECLESECYNNPTTLYILVCDHTGDVDVPYKFGSKYFADDMIKVLKKFYSTGRLYASTNIAAGPVTLTRTQKLVNRIIEEIEYWLEDAYVDDDTVFYNWGELLEACDLTSGEARQLIMEALESDIWDAILNHKQADHDLQFDDDGEFEDENGNFLKYGQVMRIVKKQLVEDGILEKAN